MTTTATDIRAALRRRHGCEGWGGEWVLVDEALDGACDVLAIGVWASANVAGCPNTGRSRVHHPLVTYEIKVSRSDYRRELYGNQSKTPPTRYSRSGHGAWPEKAARALAYSHFYLFAVPEGLLLDEEVARREPAIDTLLDGDRPLYVPPEAGLVEVAPDGRCRTRVDAPRRDALPLTASLCARLIRTAVDPAPARRARARM